MIESKYQKNGIPMETLGRKAAGLRDFCTMPAGLPEYTYSKDAPVLRALFLYPQTKMDRDE